MEKEKLLERLKSLLKEEQWGRIEPKDIGITKFKILDDLFNNFVDKGLLDEVLSLCKDHHGEYDNSITAPYLIGLIGYHTNRIEETVYLRKLTEVFLVNHKWSVVEKISEKVLEYGEAKSALRSYAISLEKLGRNKEAIPIWENLLKIDRFDANVAKKLAFAIIDDDLEKSIRYMKFSIEGFIKSEEFTEIIELWNKLVLVSEEDLQFFDRIERMLVESQQMELIVSLLKVVMNKYRDEENPDKSIDIQKKILEYTPDDTTTRKELIRLYQKKYGNHSQFQQFIKLSKIYNYKYPIKNAIIDFETNIVFDKDNYAYHRSWGVGMIMDITSEYIIIKFKEKGDHKMSIQMALQSLTPIVKEHMYAMEYEDDNILYELFNEDFRQFFEILLKSYDGCLSIANIKKELIPKYVELKNWSKWWSKARTKIKKDPHFGVSDKKADKIFLRDKPLTLIDELLNNFIKTNSFSEKLDIAIEFSNNVEIEEGEAFAQYFIDFFISQVKEGAPIKKILSYFILTSFSKYVDPKKVKLENIREKIVDFIKKSKDLPIISMRISSYDYKKDFVNLIMEVRDDWTYVLSDLLFEIPVRINKYIMNLLIRAHSYNIINSFINNVITGSKQYPDIFIWVSKNLLCKSWDYDWLDYSMERLTLSFFRFLNDLKKIETKGNRLKNFSMDVLFQNEKSVLIDIVAKSDRAFLGKIFDLFSGISYIEDSHLKIFHSLIIEKYPDFQKTEHSKASEDWELNIEKLVVTQDGYDKKMAELGRMIKVDMVNLTKELTKVSDVTGDLRENVEYNAFMEKQTILKKEINKMEDDLKKVEILNLDDISSDMVNIGTNVIFEDIDTGEKSNYTILGPWDADFENRILSYRTPIARALMEKRQGDEINLKIGDDEKKIRVVSISKFHS